MPVARTRRISSIEQTLLGSKAALEHEMKILKFRENKILLKIRASLSANSRRLIFSPRLRRSTYSALAVSRFLSRSEQISVLYW